MRKLTVVAAVALAVGAAQAEPVLDPGALRGVGQFHRVRMVVSPDAAVMAWLSAAPFLQGQVFVATSTDDGGWSSPVQVSGSYPDWVLFDGGAGEFALARASNGTYWLAWSADTGRRVTITGGPGADTDLSYVVHSPDLWVAASADGRTWSAPQPVALAPTPDHDPGIIEMPDGRIGIIWVSGRDGNEDLSLSFQGNVGEWDEAVQITSGPARDSQYELAHVGPKYVPDSRGRLTLAWVSDRSREPQVWTAVSADGRNWSQPVQVSRSAADKGFLTIEDLTVNPPAPGPNEPHPGYNLYWSLPAGENEQRWVSHSPDFVAWSEPELAPPGK